MTHQPAPLCQLLASMFEVFASPIAQRDGVTFDRELTALWAEAMREIIDHAQALETALARRTSERDQLLAIARDADLVAFAKTGAPRPSPNMSNIIDLSAVFSREQARRRQPQFEGAPA